MPCGAPYWTGAQGFVAATEELVASREPTSKTKTTVAARDNMLPSVDTPFQPAKAVGKSGIRRGCPAKPRKCWGKKVKFTPVNRDQKCTLPQNSEGRCPDSLGAQR